MFQCENTFKVSTKKNHIQTTTLSFDVPWFFSDNRDLVAGKNISINSGTFKMIRKAHKAAFLRIYAFGDFNNLSTSDAKSLDISGDAIAPNVHNANPTMNCVGLFKSLQANNEFTLDSDKNDFRRIREIRTFLNNW